MMTARFLIWRRRAVLAMAPADWRRVSVVSLSSGPTPARRRWRGFLFLPGSIRSAAISFGFPRAREEEISCWADLRWAWERKVVGRSFSFDFSGRRRARASALVGV